MTASDLITTYGTWGAHPDYPPADWRFEVSNDETRCGYWEWVANQIDPDY